ncbi:N-formylglutamate amidohydrolase [Paracoccus sp. p4-l81]|uniref:N-formylglutamate amidohydrolase n=1 Tax=Paracoccus sp. p4-l81 TaxID=3342806 RepID=UPI0035B76D44
MDDLPPFRLHEPAPRRSGVIFASPHSGRSWPAGIRAASPLGLRVLRSSEDAFVGHLILPARRHGAAVMTARVARGVVDLNRAADELDPALIEGLAPARLNGRVAAGLGVIPRVVARGRVILRGKITLAEAEARLAAVWHPYHAALAALIDRTQADCGQAVLIDVHSMPHDACASLTRPRPEIVLGDRFGRSADAWVTDAVAAAFLAEGFVTRRNTPFAGAYVLDRHSAPDRGRHAIQIEIDRALYMDEATLRPLPGYPAFRDRLARVWARLAMLVPGVGRLAAE